MQAPDAANSRKLRGQAVLPLVALALWGFGVIFFAAFPVGSDARSIVAGGLYYLAAIFALFLLARAVSRIRGRERVFWSLIGAGLLACFVGDFGWTSLQKMQFASQELPYQHLTYLLSYLFLAAALLYLVSLAAGEILLITALDALAVMVSSGVLIWYFFLEPEVSENAFSWSVLGTLSWPLFDAALLFLSLVVLSTERRPAFVGTMTAGFLAFIVADGLYLSASSQGRYEVGGWPDAVWALGLLLLGCAALHPRFRAAHEQFGMNPWRIFAFWLGPLSPPVHLTIVLLWGAFEPPLPAYVMLGGAVILVYMAVRVALVSFVSQHITQDREELARESEQSRLLYELHDTVKQNVHGISLTLRAALEADRRGDRAEARDTFARALAASREAEFQISRPYDELQALRNETPPGAGDFLRHRLKKFNEYFGVNTHDDLQASLAELSPAEVAAVNRVAVEAFWNVAKHSGARNMYLESRKVGSLLMIRIRDDGRGFDPKNPPPGLGLDYMHRRVREVGARLDVISTPGRGATVQLRFDKD